MAGSSMGFGPLETGPDVSAIRRATHDELWVALTRTPAITLKEFRYNGHEYEMCQRGARCTHYVKKDGIEMMPPTEVLRAWAIAAGRTPRQPLATVA